METNQLNKLDEGSPFIPANTCLVCGKAIFPTSTTNTSSDDDGAFTWYFGLAVESEMHH